MKYDLATTLNLAALNDHLPLPIRRLCEMVAGWIDGPIVVDDM